MSRISIIITQERQRYNGSMNHKVLSFSILMFPPHDSVNVCVTPDAEVAKFYRKPPICINHTPGEVRLSQRTFQPHVGRHVYCCKTCVLEDSKIANVVKTSRIGLRPKNSRLIGAEHE